jgi:CO/xanthine dehydrogenase Mo-binding subunit
MQKFAATVLVAMSLAHLQGHAADESSPRDVSSDAEAANATERARNELARRSGVTAAEFGVVSARRAQWNDSSLGCARRGSQYLQVISDGYAVVLERAGERSEVHVSGSSVVVCDSVKRSGDVLRMPARAKGIQQASEQARLDLARRLNLKPDQVRMIRMEPQRWPDSSLGCATAGESPVEKPVSGFKLHLNAAGRVYTYHTDLDTVRPCPPVESR